MKYSAANLEDIARMFEVMARNEDELFKMLNTRLSQHTSKARSYVWREAANIIRNTKLGV